MIKKIFIAVFVIAIIGGVLFFAIDGAAKKDNDFKTFPVTKGSIIDKALAVGRIDPRLEISVKSKIPGIVKKTYVDIGDKVKIDDPLFDIAPDPTPIEYAEAKRQVEIYKVTFDNAQREFERAKTLRDKQLISYQEYDTKLAAHDEAKLRLELAEEKLSLIESGKSNIANRRVENIIRSPISGTVLSRDVEEGDPIVPLTSFQAGTRLMTIAKMDNLVFKGNVDEIDVGKLSEGMPVEIEIGAISGKKIKGILNKISPKAHKEEGSTLFEVEIMITEMGSNFLRAGYSANADIIITKKEDILLIAERLIKTRDSVQYVEIQDSTSGITEREIETGLSDGINIEIVDGLEEGELLVERPPKEITGD
ncbi:MAG: efflux RND transporter periplasmic adaptor subunit [Candidatus Zixiibacteriota bacterium]